jgi:hypothetical protein
MSKPYCVLQLLDALLDAVASETPVQIILVGTQRRGRRTACRNQARLHHAAGYLAVFFKERRDLLLRWHLSRRDAPTQECQIHTALDQVGVGRGGCCMSLTCTCRCVASDRAPAPPSATDCRANNACFFTKSLRVDKETLHEPKPPSRGPLTGFHRLRCKPAGEKSALIIAASFCRALPSLPPPLANCKASCAVNKPCNQTSCPR